MIFSKHLKAPQPVWAPAARETPAYKRLEKPMEARGTNTIFMPPLRCSVLSSAWRSSAALRPPAASASLKREAITATIAATCTPHASSAPTHPQRAYAVSVAMTPNTALLPSHKTSCKCPQRGPQEDTTFDIGHLSLEAGA